MTLLFFDGLHDCQNLCKPEWTLGALQPWSNQTGRDGSANGAGSFGGQSKLANLTMSGASSTLVTGWATTFWNGGADSAAMYGWSNTFGQQLYMGLTSAGFLQFRRGNNNGDRIIGTTSGHTPVIADQNTWYYLEVKWLPHVSAGTLVVRLNGVIVLNLTGVQTASNTAVPTGFWVSPGNNFGGTLWRTDDLYCCDTTDATATQGRANNDFLGDIKVAALLPTADNTPLQWTPSTGTTHWSLVDENPANTSDYVSANGAGLRDLYDMQDLPGAAAAVYGMRVGSYGTKSDAGLAFIKQALKEPNGTVTVDPTSQGLSLGSWLAFWSPQYFTKPNAGGVFSVSDANSTAVGVESA